MASINWANFGSVAGAIAVVYLVIQSLPSIIAALKGKEKKEGNEDDIKSLIQNNTTAINSLTQLLQTQAAVAEVKEGQSTKQVDSIEGKIDNLTKIFNEHATKCDTTCRKGGIC